MPTSISSLEAPAAIGPYSHAMATGNLVFVSGQLPLDVDGGMPESAADQARQSLENVQAILKTAGSSLAKVVKATVYLQTMDDFAAVNEVYAQYFQSPYPARSCFAVAALPKNARVEIEVIAEK